MQNQFKARLNREQPRIAKKNWDSQKSPRIVKANQD